MNKAELVAAVAAKTGETKKAAEASVNAFVEVITEALQEGDKITIRGKGKFIFEAVERNTKSDKLVINIKKYC